MLLEEGTDVNHINKYGSTALMEAVKEHDLNTVQNLLETPETHAGSSFGFATQSINYADNDGNTAFILAVKYMRYSYINDQEYHICMNSQEILGLIFKTPEIDIYHVNKNGETAISLLAKLDLSKL